MHRIAVAVAALLLAPAALAQDVKLITTAELAAKLKGVGTEFVLVDSRTETEFNEGHIPGALHVPAKRTAEKLPSLAPAKDKLVIFYCNGPECTMSRKACKGAAAAGYTNIREYNEGLPAWRRAGHKVDGQPLPEVVLPAGIPAKELSARLAGAKPPVLVDVRDPDEFAAFRIKGAINLPIDAILKGAAKLPPGDLVLVDHAGLRIKVAARVLATTGRTSFGWLDGGVLGWSDAGLPTEGK